MHEARWLCFSFVWKRCGSKSSLLLEMAVWRRQVARGSFPRSRSWLLKNGVASSLSLWWDRLQSWECSAPSLRFLEPGQSVLHRLRSHVFEFAVTKCHRCCSFFSFSFLIAA
jgi:hypothetical protein